MKQFLIRPARPKRNVQCIAFVATAGLVAAMLAQGIRVRTNVLSPHEYVAPFEDISVPKLHELLQDSRFKFIATITFLGTPTGSNQTFNVPTNWNSGNNKAETIGAGGSGAVFSSGSTLVAAQNVSGGGGGGYSAQTNIVLTPAGTATYQIGTGGASVSGAGFSSSGNTGGDTWFNGATLGASSVGAKGGSAGAYVAGGTASGGAGGPAGSGVGATKNSGGRGRNVSNAAVQIATSGAGGAAGPNGNGNNGTDNTGTNAGTAGGSGDAGSGGAGSGSGSGSSSAGGNGTEYDASHGSGGGSGGVFNIGGTATSGNGGFYGAGTGAAGVGSNLTGTSGTAAGGLIVVTNTPATRGFFTGIIG